MNESMDGNRFFSAGMILFYPARSRNVTQGSLSLGVEVRVKAQTEMIRRLMEASSVTFASLVGHNGDITV